MRKVWIVGGFLMVVVAVVLGVGWLNGWFDSGDDGVDDVGLEGFGAGAEERFFLSDEAASNEGLKDISAAGYEELVVEKKNFLVLIHMTVCPAEFPLTDTARQLAKEDGLTIFALDEEEFKKTDLMEVVKYLPSLVVVRGGEVVDFLDAEADEDMEAYKSAVGLRKWVGRMVLNY